MKTAKITKKNDKNIQLGLGMGLPLLRLFLSGIEEEQPATGPV
jgi:hypothetical protein